MYDEKLIEQKALSLLKNMFGEEAVFRSGQLEAIKKVVNSERVLVVEQTGWGKSIVYFIATKIRREHKQGITFLISPLLSLMRNQIQNATKIGVIAETINSDNTEDWEIVKEKITKNQCDVLLLSPERLSNEEFINTILPHINIGMFVVDEAHCISDWGHDFRPDYQRIVNIVKKLPRNIPVLATTATANNRVIDDIKDQLGNEIYIQRGKLVRESLKIQVIELSDQAERLAWLHENIDKLPGTGIIYCLTTSDCDRVSRWLKSKGHNVESYHSKINIEGYTTKELREQREIMLMNNEIKALVATISLGMGFDKPDLGFVVHYQRPGNIVSYYQQIGRAGRNIDSAYAILLAGREDNEIQEYFINSAFPTEEEMEQVLNVVSESRNGLSIDEIMNKVNMKQGKLKDKILKFLILQNAVEKHNNIYVRTLNQWNPDIEKSKKITDLRYEEMSKMEEFVKTKDCFMQFVAEELDDENAQICGNCTNCIKRDYFSKTVESKNVKEAISFLKGDYITIAPRKKWPPKSTTDKKGNIKMELRVSEGRALCAYSDAGWGKIVKEDKYDNCEFRNELVIAAARLINNWDMEDTPTWVTSVPSQRRPKLVKEFAEKLAKELGLKYYPIIEKTKDTPEQKTMQNSNMQLSNIYDSFSLKGSYPSGAVILVDDMVDSRWTFTVIGAMLRENGSGNVYPFALSTTAGGDTSD